MLDSRLRGNDGTLAAVFLGDLCVLCDLALKEKAWPPPDSREPQKKVSTGGSEIPTSGFHVGHDMKLKDWVAISLRDSFPNEA